MQTVRAAIQARAASGSLAVWVLREARNTFWTRTVWTNEQAMKAYMSSGIHRQVMRSLAEWCDEASVAQWTQESPEPPSWEDAHHRMQRDGRPSSVNHPTEAHRNYQIPPPQVRRTGGLRFK
ncbi:MAG: DUF3291 domain-containing protein [Methylococcales bacterium]